MVAVVGVLGAVAVVVALAVVVDLLCLSCFVVERS